MNIFQQSSFENGIHKRVVIWLRHQYVKHINWNQAFNGVIYIVGPRTYDILFMNRIITAIGIESVFWADVNVSTNIPIPD